MHSETFSKYGHRSAVPITKGLLIMRLTVFLLTVGCLQVSASGLSQKITLEEKNITLEKLFKSIERQTGYSFWYKTNLLAKSKSVDVSVKDGSLNEVLDLCLKGQDLVYNIVDRTVVIKRMEPVITIRYAIAEPQAIVHGTITDAAGHPLAAVTVKNRRTGKLTTTDAEGRFSIEAVANDNIECSSVGYATQIIKLTNAGINLSIVMHIQAQEMSDLVVVGYGTQKRKDLTGSVASVNVEEVRNIPFATFDQALAGKAAGVQVTQADGSPGGVAKIRIRGGTSLMGGNDPLYVIDGVQLQIQNPYVSNQAEAVNPIDRLGSDDPNSSVSGSFSRGLNSLAGLNINDIESIDILKDASATAIYGSRAANGVVIITTKKGKQNQKPLLEANYYTGVAKALRENLLNVDEYRMVMKEAATNLNAARALAGQAPNAAATKIINDPTFLGTANTDWLGLVLRNASTQNATVSVRGGGAGSRYYTSLSYDNQKGVVQGTDFSRIAGKVSLDNEITKRFRLNTNLDYGFTKNNITNGIYSQALFAPPTLPARNPDGSVYQFLASNVGGYDYTGLQNPLALLEGINRAKSVLLIGSLTAEYDVAKNLRYKSSFAVNYANYNQVNYVPSIAVIASPSGVDPSNGGTGGQAQTEKVNTFFENTLTWDKQFNSNNRINVVGGTSWQKYRFNSFSASGQGFPDDKFLNNLSSAAISLMPTGTYGQNTLLSFYMRANYVLKDRYIFTFTGRSDASSKFPKDNRVGYFPSGGVAWRVSEEKFMSGISWLSDLKLRASAGYTGTQNIDDNLFYTLYSPYSYNRTSALVPTQLGNSDIKWETTLQKDAGLDFALFSSRISGTIGYYEKDTRDLLLTSSVAPSTSYSTVIANIARIRNRGLEIDLRSEIIRHKNFGWIAAFNASSNRSKVLGINGDFTDPNSDPATAQYYLGNSIVRNGEPIGLFYGKVFKGIIQTQKQLDDYKAAYLYSIYFDPYLNIGDPMYELDSTGFPAQEVIGQSMPKLFGGFTNTFTFKNFSLVTLLSFSFGGKILYERDIDNLYITTYTNKDKRILGRWTPEHTNTDRPRLILGQNGYIYTSSSQVYDGSYVKLKSVSLSYNLPAATLKKLKMQQAMIFVSGTNLFKITKYPGLDPEVSNNPYSLINGNTDNSTYPQVKQYSAGIRVSL